MTPQITTKQSLGLHAARINALNEQCDYHQGQAVIFAARTGAELNKAKELLKHGEFLPWLAQNCQLKDRQANNYMQLAIAYPEYLENQIRTAGADLPSIRTAIALITADEEIKAEVMERIAQGESVPVAEINRLKHEKDEAENKLLSKVREVEGMKTMLSITKSELDKEKADKERLFENLTDTKTSLNLAITNIDQEVAQRIKEQLPELTSQATVEAKKVLEMDYQDEIAAQLELIESLKYELNDRTYTFAEMNKKKEELYLAGQQLDELNNQIAKRLTVMKTNDDINNGYCNVLDSLIGGIAATLSQFDICVEKDKVTALCPLTTATLQKVDKAIAKLDDTLQILTLLLRTSATS
ncbi:Protein of unknown function DUF3102 [uncultured Caudovirales phage]|uniref:DUF3102 domain-containing protein n=1 Tax=uncultured Caudovirales phage TaxID=2100421 RepID=A0A6J5RW45_9CAUD|nr:Protein of unknown function DUF3102 [uncultured Caudovirales phage]CAB4202664.1 Protein of unknown function DUF3102 [uncultured Caudovirales phage]